MNIQGINAAYGKTFEPKKPEQKSVPAHTNDLKAEKVEISDKSSELQKLMAIVEEISDIRLDIVKEIRAKIKTNDYPLENNLDEAIKNCSFNVNNLPILISALLMNRTIRQNNWVHDANDCHDRPSKNNH